MPKLSLDSNPVMGTVGRFDIENEPIPVFISTYVNRRIKRRDYEDRQAFLLAFSNAILAINTNDMLLSAAELEWDICHKDCEKQHSHTSVQSARLDLVESFPECNIPSNYHISALNLIRPYDHSLQDYQLILNRHKIKYEARQAESRQSNYDI